MEKDFLNLSSEIGNNFTLIQGAGGNTSYKEGNYLYIKASGFKLKNSLKENIFVPVNLKTIFDNLRNKKQNPLEDSWNEVNNMRPSIETTMHAILPQKYIIHTHCLNSLSWLIQKNYEKEFSKIFKGYKYCIIKYAKPGLSITREIDKIKKEFVPDIIFLANHGVVIGANKLDEARNLIYFVSNALKQATILKSYIRKKTLRNEYPKLRNFKPIKYEKAHELAHDPESIKIIISGALFPDQVVYLGPKPFLIINEHEFQFSNPKIFELNNYPKIIIVPNLGILVSNNISDSAEELVFALYIIVSNIPKNSEINFLNKKNVNELVNWDSEIYRLNLNKN